ncbi:hypothetical protein Bbelb_168070 [Branchiostoma belcheri]|nr:hypothetical protein Bbelb_168070 [Branchiostoma belcheri]
MPNVKGSVVRRMQRKRISGRCGVCGGELCDKVGKVRPTNACVTRQAAREKELSACVCLGILGEDNLVHIFNFLCLRDLMNVSRTCKIFNELAHTKHLWTHVSLRSTRISRTSWQRAVQMFNIFGTRRLDVTNINNYVDNLTYWKIVVLPALSHIKSLRQLHFLWGHLPANQLEEVTKCLPHLETLVVERVVCSLDKWPPWTINICETPALLDFGKFCSMKNLQNLQLKAVGGIRLPSFSFSRGLSKLSELTSLRVLSLTTLQDVPAKKFDFLPSLVHLHTLRLGNCTHWDLEVYKNLGELTGLEYLYLENGGASPKISAALVNLTSNSLFFAQLGVNTFDARRRKLTHSFAARLLASGNDIISLLLHSDAFPRSQFWRRYCQLKVLELVIFILPVDLSIILPSMPHLHTVVLVPHMEDDMGEVNGNCLRIIQSLGSCSQLRKLRWGVPTHHRHQSHTEDNTESIPVPHGCVSWRTANQTALGDDGKDANCLANKGNSSKLKDQNNGSRPSSHTMKLRSSRTSNAGSTTRRVDKKVEPTDDQNVPNTSDSRPTCKEVASVSRPHHRVRADNVFWPASPDEGEVLVSVNQLNSVLKPRFPKAEVSVSRIYVAEQ